MKITAHTDPPTESTAHHVCTVSQVQNMQFQPSIGVPSAGVPISSAPPKPYQDIHDEGDPGMDKGASDGLNHGGQEEQKGDGETYAVYVDKDGNPISQVASEKVPSPQDLHHKEFVKEFHGRFQKEVEKLKMKGEVTFDEVAGQACSIAIETLMDGYTNSFNAHRQRDMQEKEAMWVATNSLRAELESV